MWTCRGTQSRLGLDESACEERLRRTRRLLNSHFGDQVDKEIWEYPEVTVVEPSVPTPVLLRQDGDFRIYIQN